MDNQNKLNTTSSSEDEEYLLISLPKQRIMAMSRLDWITAVIVIICVAALGFLVYKTVGLMDTDTPNDRKETVITDTPTDDDGTNINATTETKDTISDDGIDYADGDEDTSASEEDNEEEGTGKEEEMENEDSPSNYIQEENISGSYLVIAGSFKQKINAKNLVKRLRKMGYNNARVSIFNKGAYAVALVDSFDGFSEADNLVTKLKEEGIDAAVQKKR